MRVWEWVGRARGGVRHSALSLVGVVSCLLAALLLAPVVAQATTTTFTTRGCGNTVAANLFTVPAGASTVQITAIGSAGEAGYGGLAGGTGDVVGGKLSGLSAGQKLDVCVDYGGGAGSTGIASTDGGAGGGASGVALGSDFSAPVLIAAGGGGGGGWEGGGGGAAGDPNGLGGGSGSTSDSGGGGAMGATVGTAGVGNSGCSNGLSGAALDATGPGVGGAGGSCSSGGAGGGGGGAGYSGGGGGGGGSTSGEEGGGGGGSDFCSRRTAPPSLSGCGPAGTNPTFGTAAVLLTYTQLAYQPDAQIKLPSDSSYLGVGIINTTGAGQTRSTTAAPGNSATFDLRFVNAGSHSDAIAVKGCTSSAGFAVKYFKGTTNVTTSVTAGTYKTGMLAAGASQVLKLKVAVSSTATPGKIDTCAVTTSSRAAPSRQDLVKAKVKVG